MMQHANHDDDKDTLEWRLRYTTNLLPHDARSLCLEAAQLISISRSNDCSITMTPTQFTRWLADMKSAGLARSDAACAKLLGISANAVVKMKRRGADLRTALACRALLHRLEPYK